MAKEAKPVQYSDRYSTVAKPVQYSGRYSTVAGTVARTVQWPVQ